MDHKGSKQMILENKTLTATIITLKKISVYTGIILVYVCDNYSRNAHLINSDCEQEIDQNNVSYNCFSTSVLNLTT